MDSITGSSSVDLDCVVDISSDAQVNNKERLPQPDTEDTNSVEELKILSPSEEGSKDIQENLEYLRRLVTSDSVSTDPDEYKRLIEVFEQIENLGISINDVKETFDETERLRFQLIEYNYISGLSEADLPYGGIEPIQAANIIHVQSDGELAERVQEFLDGLERRAILKQEEQQAATLDEIHERIKKVATENDLIDHISLVLDRKGLEINFDSVALFESGNSEIDKSGISLFEPILAEIRRAGRTRLIDISGHTDDVPYVNGGNWRLSAERALALHKILIESGMLEQGTRLIAYSDTDPKMPIDDLNGTELEKARSFNRRVSILIGRTK